MLKVDYDAMADASKTLIDQGDTFEECINTMSRVVEGLPGIWEAETCDRYVEQYGEARGTLDKVRELIQEMAEQMQKISDNFRDADADMKGQM